MSYRARQLLLIKDLLERRTLQRIIKLIQKEGLRLSHHLSIGNRLQGLWLEYDIRLTELIERLQRSPWHQVPILSTERTPKWTLYFHQIAIRLSDQMPFPLLGLPSIFHF